MGLEDKLKIIRCYKKRPVLWNTHDPQFGKKGAKILAWNQLAKEMTMPAERCMKKIKYIRYMYNRERSKVLSAKMNKKAYVTTWYAFKSLKFLDEHLGPIVLNTGSSKEDHLEPSSSNKEDDSQPSARRRRASNCFTDSGQDQEEPRKSRRISSRAEKSMIQSEIVSSQDSSMEDNYSFADSESADENEGVLVGNDVKIENISCYSESEVEDNDLHQSGSCQQEMIIEDENSHSASRNEEPQDQIQNEEQMPVIVNYQGHASGLPNGLNRSWISSGEDEECQSYGVYIGNKLRNYNKSMRSKVQHAFSNIIFSADQGHLDPV